MNTTLQTLFQYLTDPCDLADSISAFLLSRSEKLRPTVEALSGVIDGSYSSEDFVSNTNIYHKWSMSLAESTNTGTYIDLDEVVAAIDNYVDDVASSPLVKIYDFDGLQVDSIELPELLDRMNNLLGENEMLVTALNIAQQSVDDQDQDFLVSNFAKIDGYLHGSNLAGKLKGIFTSIYEEIRENVQDPTYLVESILTHFGIIGDNADPRRNDVSDYQGQSPRCILFMNAADKLGWAIANLPTAAMYVAGFVATVVVSIGKLFEKAYQGLQKLTEKAIIKLFELDDGIQKTTIPGRGYIKHPGFSVVFNDQYTHFPTGELLANLFDNIKTALGDAALEHQQYTVPAGPVAIYLDWSVDKAKITYDIKPLDYKVYKQIYNNHFAADPYFSIKAVGGVIKADSNGEMLTGKTRAQLLDFVKDVYSHNNIWGMDYPNDADRFMCIQAAKHLCSILYVLSDDSVSTVEYSMAADAVSACLYTDITKEHGYNSQTQAFIPENINFASLCTMMGYRDGRIDCFNGYLNDNNELDYTDSSTVSYITSYNVNFILVLGSILYRVIENDPLSTADNYFVPYFHKFKLYRPSYYIPTDTDNVTHLKRMIVTGLTVVGVIVVVAVLVYLGAKFKKKKWMMEQQAAQKAFTASESGNATLLQEGWKLQKRVNLLGIFTGAAESAASTPLANGVSAAVTSIKEGYSSGSQPAENVSLVEIRGLLKSY